MVRGGKQTFANVTDRPILLKNSISAGHKKILASKRCEACVDVRGHTQQLPSPRTVSWQAYEGETDGSCARSHIRAKFVIAAISSFSNVRDFPVPKRR